MLSQKHSAAEKVRYNSGFFITTNVLPDFGIERDQEAVYRRLKVFHTRPLQKKDSSVTGKVQFFSLSLIFEISFINLLIFSIVHFFCPFNLL